MARTYIVRTRIMTQRTCVRVLSYVGGVLPFSPKLSLIQPERRARRKQLSKKNNEDLW